MERLTPSSVHAAVKAPEAYRLPRSEWKIAPVGSGMRPEPERVIRAQQTAAG